MDDGIAPLHDADHLTQIGEVDLLRVPRLPWVAVGRRDIVAMRQQFVDCGAADAPVRPADENSSLGHR